MNMKQKKKCVFVRARESDVDRMNENDGGNVGGVYASSSSLPFFLSFLLPKRVEPHIGRLLSFELIEDCSNLLRKNAIIFIKFSSKKKSFSHHRIEKTFSSRLICSMLQFHADNMKKNA